LVFICIKKNLFSVNSVGIERILTQIFSKNIGKTPDI